MELQGLFKPITLHSKSIKSKSHHAKHFYAQWPSTRLQGIKCKQWASWPFQRMTQGNHTTKVPHKNIFKVQRASTCQPRLLQETCGLKDYLQGFQDSIKSSITMQTTCGVAKPSPRVPWSYHDIIIAWMTTEWVINASLTHLGFLQRPLGLQDHL